MKKFLLLFLFCSLSMPLLFAQSNELIDEIINADQVKFGSIATLILQSQNKISSEASVQEAMTFLENSQWFTILPKAEKEATLGQVCFLIMKTYQFEGGAGWTIIPTPRSATRELSFRRAIYSNNQSPYRKIPGFEAMTLLNWALEHSIPLKEN